MTDGLDASMDFGLGDLVEGFDAVSDVVIPYSRMPKRVHSAFGAEFTTWGEMAGETVRSLLSRRYAGEGTINALIAGARESVSRHRAPVVVERVGAAAAIRRLLGEFDDERDRVMLRDRVWRPVPRWQIEVAQDIGAAHPAWVARHLPRAQARFDELLAEPVHREIVDCAAELGQRLGPYASPETVTNELWRMGVEQDTEAGWMLMHLAGPYTPVGSWVETKGGQRRAAEAVADVFERLGAPPVAEVHRALAEIGMAPSSVAAYIDNHLQVRWVGDQLVRWGDTVTVRTEAFLHARGAPATVEEIHAALGEAASSLDALQQLLNKKNQFIRTSLRLWGLRSWDVDEYSGVANAIGTLIDNAGGRIEFNDLVAEMRANFPDVAEGSVRAYARTLAFVVEDGVVRRRRPRDRWPKLAPLHTARGAFRNGDNEIRLAFAVSRDVLRGSGIPLPAPCAAALGVKPGKSRKFSGPHGSVAVRWALASTIGPQIGSLRVLAGNVGVSGGDTLVLVFDLNERAVKAVGVSADASAEERLRHHLGRGRVTRPVLAAALDCARSEVESVLRGRGDDALADAVEDVLH